MPKPPLEFFPVGSVKWVAVSAGVWERVLARDEGGVGLTRILRWDPGLDTSLRGPAAHDHVEEVLILSGSMHDLSLDMTFTAGDYACRPPGVVHGPWVSRAGCEMFEVRYAQPTLSTEAPAAPLSRRRGPVAVSVAARDFASMTTSSSALPVLGCRNSSNSQVGAAI